MSAMLVDINSILTVAAFALVVQVTLLIGLVFIYFCKKLKNI